MDAISRFARLDALYKAKEHAQVRTVSGATVSIVAGVLMFILFCSEVSFWRTTRLEDHLLVDTGQGDREFDIDLDVTFHALTCREVVFGAEDAKGVPYEESRIRITRIPLALMGDPRIARAVALNPNHPLGSNAMSTPGCRVTGSVKVKRVAGGMHVAAPRMLSNMDGRMAFMVPPELINNFNASHTIHHFAFGPAFPGQISPLDGVSSPPSPNGALFQYYIKVVPTIYESLYGASIIDSQQYSASDFVQVHDPANGQYVHPGVWWRFDFSPIMVRRVETRRTFLQFLTSLCALLGGVFAISGLVDQLLYRSIAARKEK